MEKVRQRPGNDCALTNPPNIKKLTLLALLAALQSAHTAIASAAPVYTPRHDYAPYKALEIDVGIPTKQFRAAPVNLDSGQRGLAVVFGQDPNVDPAESSFFFPQHKPIMAVFALDGKELWRRELTYSIPGTWFVPLLPFDMDRDGADELYYVENTGPKPFVYKNYKLMRADARTGKVTGTWPWRSPLTTRPPATNGASPSSAATQKTAPQSSSPRKAATATCASSPATPT